MPLTYLSRGTRALFVLSALFSGSGVILTGDRGTAQPPEVSIVYLDQRGEETFAPLTSQPRPVVTLDPVQIQDVELREDELKARVRVSGEVTDPLADIVSDHRADITHVTIEGQRVPVTRIPEDPSALQPFPFRGRFETTVEVFCNNEVIVVAEATNAVDGRGVDTFALQFDMEVHLPQVISTGNYYTLKFLDPFTLVPDPTRPDRRDSLTFFHGVTGPEGPDSRLLETAPESLLFEGTLGFDGGAGALGKTRLQLEAPFPKQDPTQPDRVRATFSSWGLAIVDQTFEFLETEADSGVFRNRALRLPNNEKMLLTLDMEDRIDAVTVQLGSWKSFIGIDKETPRPEARLSRPNPASPELSGRVPGLGSTTVQILGIEKESERWWNLHVLLDSSELELDDYYLELSGGAGRIPGKLLFFTETLGPSSVTVPPRQPDVARLTGVVNDDHPPRGIWEPIWIVAQGLTSVEPGDYGRMGDQRIELTTEEFPGSTPGKVLVRSKLPFVFVRDPGELQAPNVLPALEPRESLTASSPAPKLHVIELVLAPREK